MAVRLSRDDAFASDVRVAVGLGPRWSASALLIAIVVFVFAALI